MNSWNLNSLRYFDRNLTDSSSYTLQPCTLLLRNCIPFGYPVGTTWHWVRKQRLPDVCKFTCISKSVDRRLKSGIVKCNPLDGLNKTYGYSLWCYELFYLNKLIRAYYKLIMKDYFPDYPCTILRNIMCKVPRRKRHQTKQLTRTTWCQKIFFQKTMHSFLWYKDKVAAGNMLTL